MLCQQTQAQLGTIVRHICAHPVSDVPRTFSAVNSGTCCSWTTLLLIISGALVAAMLL